MSDRVCARAKCGRPLPAGSHGRRRPSPRARRDMCAVGFSPGSLSRTLLGTASWERGRPARIDRRRPRPPICGRDARVPRTPCPRKQLRGVKSAGNPLEPTPNHGRTPSPWGKKYLDPRSPPSISRGYEQRPGLEAGPGGAPCPRPRASPSDRDPRAGRHDRAPSRVPPRTRRPREERWASMPGRGSVSVKRSCPPELRPRGPGAPPPARGEACARWDFRRARASSSVG